MPNTRYFLFFFIVIDGKLDYKPPTRNTGGSLVVSQDDCQRTGWGRVGLQGNGSHERIKSIALGRGGGQKTWTPI